MARFCINSELRAHRICGVLDSLDMLLREREESRVTFLMVISHSGDSRFDIPHYSWAPDTPLNFSTRAVLLAAWMVSPGFSQFLSFVENQSFVHGLGICSICKIMKIATLPSGIILVIQERSHFNH